MADDAPTRLTWEYLAHSEVGLVRKNNQDSGLVSADLLVVADGMGGAAAGDLASAVAVDTLAHTDLQSAEPVEEPSAEDQEGGPSTTSGSGTGSGPSTSSGTSKTSGAGDKLHRLAAALSAANTRIADLVTTDYTLEGMGTTVTAVVLDGDGIGLVHIGDSRGYLFRDGRLTQLTHDHSWVQSLIDEGKISVEEAAAHPHRSLLLKVLNGQPANEPDLDTIPLRPGDRLVLCSDGLCGFVDDEEIAEALDATSRREAMDRLVEAAHAAGGLDNITIIIADLVDAANADPEATAMRSPIAARPGSRRAAGRPASVPAQEIDGPLDGPELIGAAWERDVTGEEDQIRERANQRDADADEDGDFVDADYEAADDLEDEDRYAPQPPRKRRWGRPLILTLVVVLILAVASAAGFSWTRTQYYVGAHNESVAIFQGLNESVPGIPLSRVYEVQQLALRDLPPYYQGMVRDGIETGTLDSARATVIQLKQTAARCAVTPTQPQQTNSPSPTPSDKPSEKPTHKASHKPTTKPGDHRTSSKPKHPSTKPSPSKSASPKAGPTSTMTSPASPLSPSPTSSGQLPGDGRC